MERITITLPEEMKGYVDARTSSGQYGNTSEFIRDLIRHDQERRAHKDLEDKILEGLNSGESTEWTARDKEEILAAVKKQAARRRKRAS